MDLEYGTGDTTSVSDSSTTLNPTQRAKVNQIIQNVKSEYESGNKELLEKLLKSKESEAELIKKIILEDIQKHPEYYRKEAEKKEEDSWGKTILRWLASLGSTVATAMLSTAVVRRMKGVPFAEQWKEIKDGASEITSWIKKKVPSIDTTPSTSIDLDKVFNTEKDKDKDKEGDVETEEGKKKKKVLAETFNNTYGKIRDRNLTEPEQKNLNIFQRVLGQRQVDEGSTSFGFDNQADQFKAGAICGINTMVDSIPGIDDNDRKNMLFQVDPEALTKLLREFETDVPVDACTSATRMLYGVTFKPNAISGIRGADIPKFLDYSYKKYRQGFGDKKSFENIIKAFTKNPDVDKENMRYYHVPGDYFGQKVIEALDLKDNEENMYDSSDIFTKKYKDGLTEKDKEKLAFLMFPQNNVANTFFLNRLNLAYNKEKIPEKAVKLLSAATVARAFEGAKTQEEKDAVYKYFSSINQKNNLREEYNYIDPSLLDSIYKGGTPEEIKKNIEDIFGINIPSKEYFDVVDNVKKWQKRKGYAKTGGKWVAGIAAAALIIYGAAVAIGGATATGAAGAAGAAGDAGVAANVAGSAGHFAWLKGLLPAFLYTGAKLGLDQINKEVNDNNIFDIDPEIKKLITLNPNYRFDSNGNMIGIGELFGHNIPPFNANNRYVPNYYFDKEGNLKEIGKGFKRRRLIRKRKNKKIKKFTKNKY